MLIFAVIIRKHYKKNYINTITSDVLYYLATEKILVSKVRIIIYKHRIK